MKILGFTESFNTCECCGKNNLKGTYIVQYIDGCIYHFGSTCVKNKADFDKTKSLKQQINEYKAEIQVRARNEFKMLGGYELESKLYDLEFLSNEYINIENKINQIKNEIRIKYINDYIKYIQF